MGFSTPLEADNGTCKGGFNIQEKTAAWDSFYSAIPLIKRIKSVPLLLAALRRTCVQITCHMGEKNEGKGNTGNFTQNTAI